MFGDGIKRRQISNARAVAFIAITTREWAAVPIVEARLEWAVAGDQTAVRGYSPDGGGAGRRC